MIPESPLSELQKKVISDLAISYKLWMMTKEVAAGPDGKGMLEHILRNQCKIPNIPTNDFEWGLLLGIYMSVGNLEFLRKERAYLDLQTG